MMSSSRSTNGLFMTLLCCNYLVLVVTCFNTKMVGYNKYKHERTFQQQNGNLVEPDSSSSSSSSKCPFATLFKKQTKSQQVSLVTCNVPSMIPDGAAVEDNDLFPFWKPKRHLLVSASRFHMFLANNISLHHHKTIRPRRKSNNPPRRKNHTTTGPIDNLTTKYIGQFYNVMRPQHSVVVFGFGGRLDNSAATAPTTTTISQSTLSTQLDFITRRMAEQFIIKIIQRMTPTNHPNYDPALRDLTNLFLLFHSGVTYEQALSNPLAAMKALHDQGDVVNQFQRTFRSMFLRNYADDQAQQRLARIHQKMHIPPHVFECLGSIVKEVFTDAVNNNNNDLDTEQKEDMVSYLVQNIVNDVSRIGCIHESYQASER